MENKPHTPTRAAKARFYINTTPGLEPLLERELRQKAKVHVTYRTKGGIEIECEMNEGLRLNHVLKVANRILWRLDHFTCRDFPRLFNKMKKFPWNDYLGASVPDFEVAAKNSRLFDSRKIEKTLLDSIDDYRKGFPPKRNLKMDELNPPTIFVRFYNDFCSISIDTTGDRLHKRHYREKAGPAPIRENIAMALVIELLYRSRQNPADYALIDPMCGTGTFLFEPQTFRTQHPRPQFAYCNIPGFEGLKIEDDPNPALFKSTHGFDADPAVLKLATDIEANLKTGTLFAQKDIFKDSYDNLPDKRLVICNPPYGKRIQFEGPAEEYFPTLIRMIKEKLNPDFLGILIPEEVILPNDLRPNYTLRFSNGGINTCFYVFRYITVEAEQGPEKPLDEIPAASEDEPPPPADVDTDDEESETATSPSPDDTKKENPSE